jgi:4-amino-4-deoxy-L-arabinose transferase-like glycosyltransferase
VSRRELRWLAGLVLFAAGVRSLCAWRLAVMFNDGPLYLELARAVGAGDLASVLRHDYHPLYPVGAALLAPLAGGYEPAAVALSVASGAAAVLFLYVFLRDAFDVRTAWIGGALLAVHPRAIEYSCDVQSDGLYLALYLAGLALAWSALRSGRAGRAAAAGGVSGLAYLARPEGLAVAVAAGVMGGLAWPLRRWSLRRSAAWLGALAAGLVVVALPYLVALRVEAGAWTLSQKKSLAQMAGLEAPAAMGATSPSAPAPGATPQPAAVPPVEEEPALVELLATAYSAARFEILVLLAIGLFAARGRPGLRGGFVLANVAVMAVVLVALVLTSGYVSRRHALPPLVASFGYAALGVPVLGGWILAGLRRLRPGAALAHPVAAAAVGLALVAALGLDRAFDDRRLDALAERRAAEWLRAYTDAGAGAVAAGRRRVAYYAGGSFVPLPQGSGEPVQAYLAREGVRYVIVDESEIEDFPGLAPLLGDGLKRLHRSEAAGHVAGVFELLPAPVGSGPQGEGR